MWRRDGSDHAPGLDGAVLSVRLDCVCHADARRAARPVVVRGAAVRRVHRRRNRDRLAAVSAAAVRTFGRRALLWGPVVAYMAAIFFLSAQSSPPRPGGLPDTVAHAIEYFGLGVVVFRAVAGGLGAQVTASRAMATMIDRKSVV